MKHKYKGSTTVALGVFLMSSLLAGTLGVRQFERFTTHEVLGINGQWPAGSIVQENMLKLIKVDNDVFGLKDPRLLIGKFLTNDKKSGELIDASDVERPERSWLSEQVPESKVLYTLKPKSGTIPHSQLRNGDSFDVLVTGRRGVRTVANDVRLVGVMKGKSIVGESNPLTRSASKKNMLTTASLVIAVEPEEVYPLASIGANEIVSIVLHGKHKEHDRESIVPDPTHRTIELLTGLKKRTISVGI